MGVHLSYYIAGGGGGEKTRADKHYMNKTTHGYTFNPAYHTLLLLLLKTNLLPPTTQFPCSQPVLGSFTAVIQDLVL